jgi:hypothetical protein
MQQQKEYYMLGESGFWRKFFSKLLFTLISVKVWGLVAATAVSTYLLIMHNMNAPYEIGEKVYERGINGAQWVTFNTTIWALIFGMKEIFRISEKRDKTEKETLEQQAESKKILASMAASGQGNATKKSRFTPDGKEIVGDEPDGEL